MSIIKNIAEQITRSGRPNLISFDKQTFESLKIEWKEQQMYSYSPKFLFGISFKVIDRLTIE